MENVGEEHDSEGAQGKTKVNERNRDISTVTSAASHGERHLEVNCELAVLRCNPRNPFSGSDS